MAKAKLRTKRKLSERHKENTALRLVLNYDRNLDPELTIEEKLEIILDKVEEVVRKFTTKV